MKKSMICIVGLSVSIKSARSLSLSLFLASATHRETANYGTFGVGLPPPGFRLCTRILCLLMDINEFGKKQSSSLNLFASCFAPTDPKCLATT